MPFSSPAQLWLCGQGQGQGRLTLQPDWLEVSRPSGLLAVGTEAQQRQDSCRAATSLRSACARRRGETPGGVRLPPRPLLCDVRSPGRASAATARAPAAGPSCLCL